MVFHLSPDEDAEEDEEDRLHHEDKVAVYVRQLHDCCSLRTPGSRGAALENWQGPGEDE